METFLYELDVTNQDSITVHLHGYLDEFAELPGEENFKGRKYIIFDFTQCRTINSSGLKKWVIFVGKIKDQPDLNLIYRNCSTMIVNQFSLIQDFFPTNASLESLYVPFYCSKCEESFEVLKSLRYVYENSHSIIYDLNEVDCDLFPGCKSHLELDYDAKSLFRFIKDRKKKY